METFMRRSITDMLRYSRESGISIHQFGALFYLQRKGTCGVSQVGEDLGVTNAAASQMIDRLVQQKLLERTEDPHDRRLKQLVLTQKGKDLVDASIEARQSWLEELSRQLTSEQQDRIISALDQLSAAAQEMEPAETDLAL
jgi:DNA-binding MarR family transcriptional regulator